MTSAPISNLRRNVPPNSDGARALLAPENLARRLLDVPELDSILRDGDRQILQSLSQESDPELLIESLITTGARWETQNRDAAAAQLYHQILSLAPEGSFGLDRVSRRFDALEGRGSFGARFEVASRRFFGSATDPAMIAGFMAAGGVASMVRGFTLGNLALRAPGFFTRGWTARGIAGAAGFAAELPALVGTTRLAHGVLGYSQGFGTLESLPQEFAGSAVFLGALKLSGLGATALARNSAYAPLIRSGGTLGGIYVAHRAEEGLGLRTAAASEMNRWFDTGETFLQLRVAGHLSNALLGPRSPALELAVRERALEVGLREMAPRSSTADTRLQLQAAAAASSFDDGETTMPGNRFDLFHAQLAHSLGPRATSEVARSFESIQRQMEFQNPSAWLELVRSSQYQDIKGFELAMQRLHYTVTCSRARGLTGSYLNWLSRTALNNSVYRGDRPRFDRMLQFLAEGGPIGDLERITAEMIPQRRLFSEKLVVRTGQVAMLSRFRDESHRTIRELPLSRDSKQSLLAYGQLLGIEGDRLTSARLIRNWLRENPEHHGLINSILERARTNPLGSLRVDRMLNIMEYEKSNLVKFRELIDSDLGVRGRVDLLPILSAPEELQNTQDDGYINEPELAQELSLLYRAMPEARQAREAAIRRDRTAEILEQVWPHNRTPFDQVHIIRALRLLDDPISIAMAEDLAADRLRLVFQTPAELNSVRRSFDKNWDGGEFYGLFRSAARDPSGRDSIYLQNRGPASNEAYRRQNFETLANLAHEHAHFTRASKQDDRTQRGVYLEESLAETRALRWRVAHGDIAPVLRHFEISPGGLGLFLADWVDRRYFLRIEKDL